MRTSGLLNKLKRQGNLEAVEPSEEVCSSYVAKSDNCIRSAKILLDHDLFDNSVIEAYYAMYNALTALLFKTGIKCENHSASISLLEMVFGRRDLSESIRKAKEERIDRQYYVSSAKDPPTRQATEDMLSRAEHFLVSLKLIIKNATISEVRQYHEKFSAFFERL